MTSTGEALRGNDLFRSLETPSPYAVWRLGGAGIAIRTPQALVYVDPFLAESGGPGWIRREPQVIDQLPPADLILATHEHEDHADPVVLTAHAQFTKTLFAGAAPSVEIAIRAGFPPERTRTLNAGDTFTQGTISVTALESVDTDAAAPLAYVITDTDSGITLYHGGDAMMTGSMPELFTQAGERYRLDVCCLSVGSISEGIQFYLSPEDSVTAARWLRAPVYIPLHWDLWTKNGMDASMWQPILETTDSPRIALLRPGERWQPEG